MEFQEVTALANTASKQNTVKVSQVFGDYLIMLIAPCVMSVWYNGIRALWVVLISIVSAVLTDCVVGAFLRKPFKIKDLSNIFIGAAIAMMMPAGIDFYIPALASFFAVAVVKVPFGGAHKAPFVPAAAGFALASVCFKEQVFDFTKFSADKFLGEHSFAAMLNQGNSVHLNAANTFDILSGNVAGPMGTTCGILMFGCCAYLFVRRRRALLATAGFIGACAVWAMLFPRINASPITSVVLELSAGSLMFAAVFLLTDHATLPKNSVNRVVYGVLCGVICMAMRYVGAYEETVCFAVLFANGFRPVFDYAVNAMTAFLAKRKGAAKA